MSAWKKICCAIDFSPCSDAALQEAARLAASADGTLTLVHVFAPPTSAMVAGDLFALTPSQLAEQVRQELEPQLAARKADAERIAGEGRVDALLVPGKPADEILRVARSGGFDLVVIGTHGRHGVKRLVLGSVAEHVVRTSPASVLVVRAKERDDPAGHG